MPRIRLWRPLFVLIVVAAAVAVTALATGTDTARAKSISQPPTATPGLPGYPPPGGGPPVPIQDTRLAARVPSADIAAALANPDTIAGWMTPRNSSIPYDPYFNPYRTCLTVRNLAVPYHRAFNPLVFKAGCP